MTSKLEPILMKLIIASEHDRQPHQKQLPHGLFVEIMIIPTKFTLRIWRLGEPPSEGEWRTVVRDIPHPFKPQFASQSYAELTEGARHIFSGSWPAPPRMFMFDEAALSAQAQGDE
jgi:hypothetical protein